MPEPVSYKRWTKQPIHKARPSRVAGLREEAEAIDEQHRRLKAEYLERLEASSCKRGHKRIDGNLILRPDGAQECRRCRDERRAQRNAERRKPVEVR
jgi:hypothetical protein